MLESRAKVPCCSHGKPDLPGQAAAPHLGWADRCWAALLSHTTETVQVNHPGDKGCGRSAPPTASPTGGWRS
jgi:hypothetical protein